MPGVSAIDRTTDMIFGAILADRGFGEAGASSSDQVVEQPAPVPTEHHSVVWVANEPRQQDQRGPTAEEAIRERERRTRQRWAEEHESRARVDVHHHLHHNNGPVESNPRSDDDIVDAEVVEESVQPPLVRGGVRGALPPGSTPDPPVATGRDREVRRRDT